jgi:hypothetical protein
MSNLGIVGSPYFPEGQTVSQARYGTEGDMISSELHGRYYEKSKRGGVFIGFTAAAGIVIPIYSNTTQLFGLWNTSTTKVLSLIKLTIGIVGTPSTSGNVGLAIVTGAGTTVATGAPISAFTVATTVINAANLVLTISSAGKICTTATIIAPTIYIPLGFNSPGVLAAASVTTPWYTLIHDFDGTFLLPPGAAVFVSGNVLQTAAFNIALVWEESPITSP